MGWAFARAGWTVVSGLALGVDGAAHRGALTSGRTAAVLGHGLGQMYPRVHASLREDIQRQSGCVLTEYRDDQRPSAWRFPERNRWIAGLAQLIIVVEATEKSGALWTARHAASMERELAVVEQRGGLSSGCRALASRGVPVVRTPWEWLEHRGLDMPSTVDPWLKDVLTGESLEQVALTHNESEASLCGALGEWLAQGKVEAVGCGRYAPRGREW